MLSFAATIPARWPHTVMIAVAIVWAALAWAASPLFDHVYVSDGSGVALLVCYVLAFIAGSVGVYLVCKGWRIPAPAPIRFDLRVLFWVVAALAVIGVMSKLVDHVLLQHQAIDLGNLSQAKIDATLKASKGKWEGPSLFSVVTSPLIGCCFFPALIWLVRLGDVLQPRRLEEGKPEHSLLYRSLVHRRDLGWRSAVHSAHHDNVGRRWNVS
jgi:hypothetical protein